MRDFIINLAITIVAVALISDAIIVSKDINKKTDRCKKIEYISGIRTAIIDGNCYKFANNTFVKINFEELDK